MTGSLPTAAAPGHSGGRTVFRGLSAAAVLGLPAALTAQAPQRQLRPEIAVTPVIVHLAAGAQEAATAIVVRNAGAGPGQLRFYLGDYEQDVNGDFRFLPFGQGAHSCGGRLTAFPDGAVVRAGERQQIQVRLAAGAGVCWGMLFVETAPQGRGMLRVVERVGVKIMNAPPGASAGGEVTTVTASRARGDTIKVRALFRNTGEAPLDLRGRIEIRDYGGRILAQSEFGPFGSLPGRDRVMNLDVVARLPRGDYVAVPIIDFGGEYLAGGQGTLRVR